MRYGAISLTASAHVNARPSRIGSPRPVIPALVWILRNNQRGLTRKVSSLVILRLSLDLMGASCSAPLARAAKERPARPAATTERRVTPSESDCGLRDIKAPCIVACGIAGDSKP